MPKDSLLPFARNEQLHRRGRQFSRIVARELRVVTRVRSGLAVFVGERIRVGLGEEEVD